VLGLLFLRRCCRDLPTSAEGETQVYALCDLLALRGRGLGGDGFPVAPLAANQITVTATNESITKNKPSVILKGQGVTWLK
jgi:hypothetical protein